MSIFYVIGVVVVALPGFFVLSVVAGAAVVGWKAAQRAGNWAEYGREIEALGTALRTLRAAKQ